MTLFFVFNYHNTMFILNAVQNNKSDIKCALNTLAHIQTRHNISPPPDEMQSQKWNRSCRSVALSLFHRRIFRYVSWTRKLKPRKRTIKTKEKTNRGKTRASDRRQHDETKPNFTHIVAGWCVSAIRAWPIAFNPMNEQWSQPFWRKSWTDYMYNI